MARINKLRKWVEGVLTTIYPVTIPQAVIDPVTKIQAGFAEEEVVSQAINELLGRVSSLEQVIGSSEYKKIQVEDIDVLKNINFQGRPLFIVKDHAPDVIPDGVPQFWINTSNGDFYSARNNTSVSDWTLT